MPVADFAQNVQTPFFPMVRHTMDGTGSKHGKTAIAATTPAAAGQAQTTASTSSGDGKSFFRHVLDVINPLQHLPIVGTVYRAITGEKIGDVEKVAGDTLYGGPVGLVSSLADVAFEKITGKDFGSTVMGLFGIGDDTKPATTVAANAMKPLPSRTTAAMGPVPFASTPMATSAPALLTATPTKTATPSKADAQTVAAQLTQSGDKNTQALMAAMSQNGVDSDLGMRALFAYQKSIGLAPAAGADAAP